MQEYDMMITNGSILTMDDDHTVIDRQEGLTVDGHRAHRDRITAPRRRPGGPVDVLVALACFVPVAIADLGVIRPAKRLSRRHRLALGWLWIMAVLFVLPVIYGVASTVTPEGVQGLLPSAESAYAGAIALYLMSWFSVVGLVHHRLGVRPLQRHASLVTSLVGTPWQIDPTDALLFLEDVETRRLAAPPGGNEVWVLGGPGIEDLAAGSQLPALPLHAGQQRERPRPDGLQRRSVHLRSALREW